MNFEFAKNSYRNHAIVQKQMAKFLVDELIRLMGQKFEKIFEIGSGTGFLTDNIYKDLKFSEIVLNDITENFTRHKPTSYIKGDIMQIDIPHDFNLIISNAVFQWISNYEMLFYKLKNALETKSGVLAFSTFGKENFIQIKNITGIGLNYPNLDKILKKTGFEIVYFEQTLKTLYFDDFKKVLKHIKFTGVGVENKFWTKKDFEKFKALYLEKYYDNFGFELTYHPVFYILKTK